MARSHGIIKTQVWEAGSEYRLRTLAAQWCYVMLISQPQINNCGVLPYVPEKWVRLAAGLDERTLISGLAELQTHRFIVLDEEAGELLVRTFIKHDRIWKQPNLVTAARREYRSIESDRIRAILVEQHPWLIEEGDPQGVKTYEEKGKAEPLSEGVPEGVPEPLSEGVSCEPLSEPLPEGVPEGVSEGVSEPLPEGVNAHARAAPSPFLKTKACVLPSFVAQYAGPPHGENSAEEHNLTTIESEVNNSLAELQAMSSDDVGPQDFGTWVASLPNEEEA